MVDHQNKRQGSLSLSSGRARSVKLEEDVDVADGFSRLNVAKLEVDEEALPPPPPQDQEGVVAILAALVEDMECCVCLEPLVSPCLTPCGHTLCERDLCDWRSTGKKSCPYCRSEDAYPAPKNLAIEAMMVKWLPKALSEEDHENWIKRNAAWTRDRDATLAAAALAVERQARGGHHHRQDRPIAALPERQREGAPPPFDRNDAEYQRFLAERQQGRAAVPPMFGRARVPDINAPVQRAAQLQAAQDRLDELHRILGRVERPAQHQGPPNRPRPRVPAQLDLADILGQLNAAGEGPPRHHGRYAGDVVLLDLGWGFGRPQAPPPVGPRAGRANANANPPPPVPRPAPADAAAAMRAVDRANRNLADAIDRQAQVLRARDRGDHLQRLEELHDAMHAGLCPLPRPAPIQRPLPPAPAPAPAPATPAQDPRRRAHAHLRHQGPPLRRNGQEIADGLRQAMRVPARRVRFEGVPGDQEEGAGAPLRAGLWARAPVGALGALNELADQVSRLLARQRGAAHNGELLELYAPLGQQVRDVFHQLVRHANHPDPNNNEEVVAAALKVHELLWFERDALGAAPGAAADVDAVDAAI